MYRRVWLCVTQLPPTLFPSIHTLLLLGAPTSSPCPGCTPPVHPLIPPVLSAPSTRRTDIIPVALLGDYQKLLSSAPTRRLNPSKVRTPQRCGWSLQCVNP